MSQSSESRELDLVGKVEMRIALADDNKLESVLKTYLPPLLLKLNSEYLSVKDKVISTCQHIKVRLSGNQDIVLPVLALLKQYINNPGSPTLRHLDLMFIQQSVGKLSTAEQLEILPILLHGMYQDSGKPTCATLFNLFLHLLPSLRIQTRDHNEDNGLRRKLGLDERPEEAKFVASWIGKLVLLSIVRPALPVVTCAGLTVQEYEFLTLNGKEQAWNPNVKEGLNLTLTKITALSFLASEAFTDEERLFPALFSSADTNSRISSIGEDMLKRSTMSFENQGTVAEVFRIYFIVKPAMQTKLLGILSKSVSSTTFPSKIISVVQQGIRPHDNTNLPIEGLEATKFYSNLWNYLNWVSRVGAKNDLSIIAPKVVKLLKDFIEDQGWPVPYEKLSDDSLRALAYETLGSLAKTTAHGDDLSLVEWLFKGLAEDNSSNSISVSIDSAMASLLQAFAAGPLSPALKKQLRSLLLRYMELGIGGQTVRSTRLAAVRWANRCLDYNDIVARWIDILALAGRADERNDVTEEGKKGLDPYWFWLLNSLNPYAQTSLPVWSRLVKVFFTSESLVEDLYISNSMKSGMEVDSVSVFGNFAGARMNAYATSIDYCRRMLLLGALEQSVTPLTIDADWERQLDVQYRSDKASRKAMTLYIKSMDSVALKIYLSAAFEGMLMSKGNSLGACGRYFTDIASIAPTWAVCDLAERSLELMQSIRSNDTATRFVAAHAFGMLAAHPSASSAFPSKALQILLGQIKPWASAIGADANKLHGSILATGYLLSRLAFYDRLDTINHVELDEALAQLMQILEAANNASLREAIFHALGQISCTGIPLTNYFHGSPLEAKGIINIIEEAKKGNENAISSLGRLALIFDDDVEGTTNTNLIIDSLYALFELKQVDIHFAIGEALGCASAGWDSDALLLSIDVDTTFRGRRKRTEDFESLLERLLLDCRTPKPSLKKASGIWLFTLIQNCGHLSEVQARLRECQIAFMGLLSARDELVQETASRGLSLVYEQGDADLKAKLVKDLIASFTGTSTQLKVDEDTELFESGALPTGEGKSVTSYKDIISLANEVGDQSLVYKFMTLAANSATWSTRSAFGKFGLSNILSQSEIDPKLYPKLYRYRFDPNSNVRRSMNDIWNALVKDPNSIINEHFDNILADLLKSILGKEWRVREASCAAISSLVNGQDFEKYEKHLSDIWEVAFKVMDDIKGSVREAAKKLSMALTGILVRQIEAGTTSRHAQAMLHKVLPFLLSGKGLESHAEDVRVFAATTILKLIKSGGKVLLPFVPTLVEQLLGLLSTLETEGVDYLYLNAAKYKISEERIDTARSSAVSHSPLMEAIERCLDILDEPTMAELIPNLQNVIKTAVGMPSKIGCSGILVSLATRHSFLFRPHADTLLRLIEKSVLDRNNAVSAAYARSAGYLARLASEKSILPLVKYAKDLYLNAEDESRRQIAGDIFYDVSKFATDRFNALAAEFLPFIFFAKHDFDDHVKERFEKTWSENVGGSRAVLLYLQEITNLCTVHLESTKWNIKHTAALAVAEIASSNNGEFSIADATLTWPVLEKALALKTFLGKEKVLGSFVKFAKGSRMFWELDTSIAALMKKIAIREAKRNNDAYRPHSFSSLAEYCKVRSDIDIFDDVYGIVTPILEDFTSGDKMDMSGSDKAAETSYEDMTIVAGIEALFKAVNLNLASSSPSKHLLKLLESCKGILASTKSTVAVRTTSYERIKTLFEEIVATEDMSNAVSGALLGGFFELLQVASGSGSEIMRTKRAEAAEVIVLATKKEDLSSEIEKMKQATSEGRSNEKALAVQIVLDRVLKLLVG